MNNGDELGWIEWLRAQQPTPPAEPQRTGDNPPSAAAVKLGIGDDMAVVDTGDPTTLISSDMLLDGVHFDTSRHALQRIGRKAIGCVLSDCAAMAVRPVAATVSLAWPKGRPMIDARELFSGMVELASAFDLAIVGGDTTCWAHPLAVDVSLTASPYAGVAPVTRSGARPGDTLYVTGGLGGSLLDKHLDFHPRVREAHALGAALGKRLHAMIDVSDGLALDLWRMCRASGVGATLEAARLEAVISDDARRASALDGLSPVDHALHDGEDFELLLAVQGTVVDPPAPLHTVGQVTARGLEFVNASGIVAPLRPEGYVHNR